MRKPIRKRKVKSIREKLLDKLYVAWREYIYKRDKYMCQLCGRSKKQGYVINAHHIITKGSSGFAGKYDIDNGVTLCFTCHQTDYVALADFCKSFLEKRGLDYYEQQNKYKEVAGQKPTIDDLLIKLKVLEQMKEEKWEK